MFQRYKKRLFIIIFGDLFCFYFAFILALLLRYGFCLSNFSDLKKTFLIGFPYFSFIFFVWIILFTISRLYEFPYLINNKEFYYLAFKLFVAGSIFSVLIFQIFTPQLVPKLVLLYTVFFSIILLIFWRTFINWVLKIKKRNVFIISKAREKNELIDFIKDHPTFGIELIGTLEVIEEEKIEEIKRNHKKVYFVIDPEYKNKIKVSQNRIVLFEDFYENLTGKVPLSLINEEWFLKCFSRKDLESYEKLKRVFDFIGGIILFIFSLPVWPIVGFLIKITSKGPVIYKSYRIGLNGKKFVIYKFRTMIENADQIGPSWTLENDKRITKIGKILRITHLDEVPQVLNIIKGDTSFVGPRPEEVKLVELFKKEIPFYEKRMLIKPGIIGWAQINYPHGASVEDAIEKLKYDFYYLKYRSLRFDFLIALKAWRIPFEIKTH